MKPSKINVVKFAAILSLATAGLVSVAQAENHQFNAPPVPQSVESSTTEAATQYVTPLNPDFFEANNNWHRQDRGH